MRTYIHRFAFIAATILPAGIISCNEKYSASADEAAIKTMYTEFSDAVAAKDLNRIMSFYAPGDELLAFDAFPPREYKGADAYRKDYEGFFAAFPNPVKSQISDLNIHLAGNMAYSTCFDEWTITDSANQSTQMLFRCTDVLEKKNDKWLIVHEHLSFPVDPVSGKADFLSK